MTYSKLKYFNSWLALKVSPPLVLIIQHHPEMYFHTAWLQAGRATPFLMDWEWRHPEKLCMIPGQDVGSCRCEAHGNHETTAFWLTGTGWEQDIPSRVLCVTENIFCSVGGQVWRPTYKTTLALFWEFEPWVFHCGEIRSIDRLFY